MPKYIITEERTVITEYAIESESIEDAENRIGDIEWEEDLDSTSKQLLSIEEEIENEG